MFIILKNGAPFAERETFAAACSLARKDAIMNRVSAYAIWDKQVVGGRGEKPLYRIENGVNYQVANLLKNRSINN